MFNIAALEGRPTVTRGRYIYCRCPFHEDGESPDRWSCALYPDNRFYCFACDAWGSAADIAVFLRLGRRHDGKTKLVERDGNNKVIRVLDPELLDAYREVNTQYSMRSEYIPNPARSFTEQEKVFLAQVQDLMHDWLSRDKDARRYIISRGADPEWNCFGVARPGMMPIIHEIAQAMGNVDLPRSTGLESRHPDYLGKMAYGLMDSVVCFTYDKPGSVAYYQARTLRSNRDLRYYAPSEISKVPLEFALQDPAPLLVAEGFFKVAWAAYYGFRAVGITGSVTHSMRDSFIARLVDQIYLIDNDKQDQHGEKAAKMLLNRVELSGSNRSMLMLLVPDPYKDADDWAMGIGPLRASAIIKGEYARYRRKEVLPLR